jgi:hypothetical protein
MQPHRWEVINEENSSRILRHSIRSPYYPVRSGLGVVSDRYASPHESA